ncbi:MAG TPA: GAF domain-containing SpoIIE family protein phosphatase [Longimicrobiaceae bacterium]|nr:GAF domain-containing SpoIIE family protein phosphatase [Longimicrobiaceae bacterium]
MPASAAPALSAAARGVLEDFRRAFGEGAHLWARAGEGWTRDGQPRGEGPCDGVVEVPGTPFWLELAGEEPHAVRAAARFLASALARVRRHEEEIRSFSREMAERYEEINLLYSISEILGSIISLEEAAGTILTEVASILGASRAALWVHDEERGELYLAAVEGGDGQRGPIPVDDACSITAEVFRTGRAIILAAGEAYQRPHCPDPPNQLGPFLSVPVSYSPPEGETRAVGVINLIGRSASEGFSAGDMKLLSAIASQIGAAVENNRLVAESLRQGRLVREMELAHHLQLKLLPPLEQFAGYADVAARCVPAESVGGDFYHLFRLAGGRLGVLIGDVSSHGFGAALIMALTMSAVAIHASEDDPPGEVLRRTHRALIDELESTEMYLTLFYGVIDPQKGTLTYANAGHPHAFRVPAEGAAQRLAVTDPPFGIVDRDAYSEATTPWQGGRDLLFLFTDGLSDALGNGEGAGAARLVEAVCARRGEKAEALMEDLFRLTGGSEGDIPPDDRTAVLVRL